MVENNYLKALGLEGYEEYIPKECNDTPRYQIIESKINKDASENKNI
tara:strand:+ start:261 stop:401 length:141 start_codon:yes stop_codon:yes gene_type:complete